jgi:putative DNA primase/helicase
MTGADRIREALQFVPVGGHDERVRMAFMLKSELGEVGRDLWDEWRGDRGNDEAASVWRSASETGPLKIGSLFREAQANGWRDDDRHQKPTPAEIAERKRIATERAAKEEAEIARERADTAEKAVAILRAATEAKADHPYLVRKQVSPVSTLREIDAEAAAEILGYAPRSGGERLTGRLLVVPVKQGDRISTLELIDGDGRKAALAGRGTKAGGYWATERLPDGHGDGLTLAIGEGVATALTASSAVGHPGIGALSAANLSAVAKEMRERYPRANLLFCADLVKETGKPDQHAVEAARSVGGRLAIPDFGPERDPDLTDLNDLAKACGVEAVQRAVANARQPARREIPPTDLHAAAGEYAEPVPLPRLPPVPEIPLDLLPDDLVAWVGDAAQRARFRPDFAAAASMVALGSVIGRKLGIRLKQRDDWTEYANVWGALVGPPSALKSPALRAGQRPFKALQAAADERYAAELESHEAQLEAHKLRRDAKKKAAAKALANDPGASLDLGEPAPDAPTPRTYWTSDATAERLGELLAENPHGLLVERDELSSLLVTLEDERSATARGLYLAGWSGNEGYRFDRIMRGTTTLPKFALSVVGGIQPGPLGRYVRGAFSGERADGLLQRFQLIVWPDAESFEYVDRYPDGAAKQAAAELFERADALDPDAIGSRDDFGGNPPFVRLSDAAQGLFVEWYSAFMRERRAVESGGEGAAIAAHFGKYPGLVGKLALILHVADDPASHEVSERTLLKALAWIQYLTPHARRVYHAVENPETAAAELLLSRLRRGELPARFAARDVYRKGWHGLTDREAVKKACRLLFDYAWLIEADAGGATGGRPSDPVYAVSPAAGAAK